MCDGKTGHTSNENTAGDNEAANNSFDPNILREDEKVQDERKRTFSHWPHRTTPTSSQMIEAGFFNCKVSDRVICIYCNLVCQQWTPYVDDPCEVHKTLSPNCIYVKAKLMRPGPPCIINTNQRLMGAAATGNHSSTSINSDPLRSSEIVYTTKCNPAYAEIPKRHASFATWPNENLPPVDDLVRAGFFYTGTKTIVTCFYCNGSLQNWGPNDNPMTEHAQWFPHCAYAKQLCGDELYRKIQESKRAQQDIANELREKANAGIVTNTNLTTNNRQLLIPDESTLSRLVADRLDLPISQRLLDQNFKLSIIKRCWEDQLRLKQDDFVSECDLFIACVILEKQIEHINGKKESIVIPSIKMKQIREQNKAREQRSTILNVAGSKSDSTDVEMTTSSQSAIDSTLRLTMTEDEDETETIKERICDTNNEDQSNNSTPSNICVLCLSEEKQLACLPCGHLAACVKCGPSLRSCPICRREIAAFVRIYV